MTLTDERVRFYLRHRDQLEEWWTLRLEAASAIDEWLNGLTVDFESLAADIGKDVDLVVAFEDAWPSLFLKRSTWPGTIAANATVLIGLQWARGKTLLGASNSPYVGIHCEKTTAIARALREDTQLQDSRRQRKDKQTGWWPAFSYVLPEEPFPEQADKYRQRLLDSVREAWNTYASTVDRAVALATTT
ncbi:MAG TPA: hypothetical protein VI485_07435 [Vicinamibacterales bacterium]|nr:hypothetical protein [Vicinamibacterales bacterium]